jgi:anti-anti-sigma factor
MIGDGLVVSRSVDPVSLVVLGELDIATRNAFVEALAELGGSDGDSRLDLAGVPFMDTASVTAVVRCARRLRDEGGRLVVVGPPASLLRIYRLLWAGEDGSGLFISGVRGEP